MEARQRTGNAGRFSPPTAPSISLRAGAAVGGAGELAPGGAPRSLGVLVALAGAELDASRHHVGQPQNHSLTTFYNLHHHRR